MRVRVAIVLLSGALNAGACGARTELVEPAPVAPRAVAVRSDAGIDPSLDDSLLPPAPHDALCIELSAAAGPLTVDLTARPRIERADVVFAIDRTSSMAGELAQLRASIVSVIVPGIAATIDDAQIGVVAFGDLPLLPYGEPAGDTALTRIEPATTDVAALDRAFASLRVQGGGDDPEASTEALFQLATGAGFAPFIASNPMCPSPDLTGYACTRPDAQRVFVVLTDAPSHDGPRAQFDYDDALLERHGARRGAHRYDETLAALTAAGARVVGIDSSGGLGQATDLAAFARATGALGLRDEPLVFDVATDGVGLDGRVVDAVRAVVHQARLDVSAAARDLDPDHRATALVRSVRPVVGSPAANVERTDATTFHGVLPGTELTFALVLDAGALVPGDAPQRFPLRVEFLGGGRAGLGYRDVELVLPSRAGAGCATP